MNMSTLGDVLFELRRLAREMDDAGAHGWALRARDLLAALDLAAIEGPAPEVAKHIAMEPETVRVRASVVARG